VKNTCAQNQFGTSGVQIIFVIRKVVFSPTPDFFCSFMFIKKLFISCPASFLILYSFHLYFKCACLAPFAAEPDTSASRNQKVATAARNPLLPKETRSSKRRRRSESWRKKRGIHKRKVLVWLAWCTTVRSCQSSDLIAMQQGKKLCQACPV
jgi:hypothetical protein